MHNKNAFKVGLFIISTSLLILVSIGYIAYKKDVFEKVHTYTLSSKSGDGLAEGMPIVFSGFKIGTVHSMELNDDGLVIIRIKIPERHIKWIRSNSLFTLDKPLIGSPRIVVSTEDLKSPLLSTEKIIEFSTVNDINETINKIQPIIDTVNKIMTNIEKVSTNLADPQGDVSKILKNSERLSSNLSRKTSLLEMAIGDQESIQSFYEAIKKTKDITHQVEDILKKVDTMAIKTDEEVYGNDGLLSLISKILKDLLIKLQKINTTLDDINKISNDAVDSTKDLKLLRAEIDSAVNSIGDLVNELDKKIPFKKEPEIKLP